MEQITIQKVIEPTGSVNSYLPELENIVKNLPDLKNVKVEIKIVISQDTDIIVGPTKNDLIFSTFNKTINTQQKEKVVNGYKDDTARLEFLTAVMERDARMLLELEAKVNDFKRMHELEK